jgi:hypothetical protein
MTDRAPKTGTPQPPSITAAAGLVVTGAGFLPDHDVTVCVSRAEDDIDDYLTFTTDAHGRLQAAVPSTSRAGIFNITVTDHRRDPHGADGLLWSNTETLSLPDG